MWDFRFLLIHRRLAHILGIDNGREGLQDNLKTPSYPSFRGSLRFHVLEPCQVNPTGNMAYSGITTRIGFLFLSSPTLLNIFIQTDIAMRCDYYKMCFQVTKTHNYYCWGESTSSRTTSGPILLPPPPLLLSPITPLPFWTGPEGDTGCSWPCEVECNR